MPTTNYVIDERTVLQGWLESTYGDDSGASYVSIPIYDAFDPLQVESEVIDLNRAKDSLSPDLVAAGAMTSSLAFKTFVYGSGTVTAPYWLSRLVPASGFSESEIASTAPVVTTTEAAGSGTGTVFAIGSVYQYKFTHYTYEGANIGNETPASNAVATVSLASNYAQIDLTNVPTPGASQVTRIYRTVGAAGTTFYFHSEVSSASVTDTTPDTGLDYTRTAPGAASSELRYLPLDQDHPSLATRVYLNSHYRKALGSRFNWTANFVAGQPVEMSWDGMGLYTAASAASNPTTGQTAPGMPPKWDLAAPMIRPRSTTNYSGGVGAAISPLVVKRATWTPGRTPTRRSDAGVDCSTKEIMLTSRSSARIGMVIEVDKAFAWDPIVDWKAGTTYGIKMTVGTSTFYRVEFSAPNAQQARPGRLIAEDGNVRCWDLEFIPTDLVRSGDWMMIRYY